MPTVNPESKDNPTTEQLLKYVSGYGSPEKPQSIEEIQGDFQLAGLSTILNSCLSRDPTPKVLDIGCGNGVLMAKLADIKAFENYPKLEYVGFDILDRLTNAFKTANKLKILPHSKLLPYDSNWIEHATDPCMIVIRNVFHELKIDEAARLIHEICMFLPTDSVVLLQDMITLPVAEKGRAGWLGIHLANIFENGGIKANHTPDTSKRGINVFLIEGRRHFKCELTETDIRDLLITARKEQLDLLSSKYDATKEEPGNELSLFRLEHDIATISLALKEFAGETWEGGEINDGQTVASTFGLAFSTLSDHDLDELRKNFQYPEIEGFQNREYQIGDLDKFLRSDRNIFVLGAGPYMGKKTVVWWTLDHGLKHDRLPLYVNLKEGGDILSIIEDVAVQLGIGKFVDVEVLASLRNLPTEELQTVISRALTRLAEKTILILDGFENCIDPEGKIENEDIAWLIDFWSSLHKAKIIIETRYYDEKQLPLERCQFNNMAVFKGYKHQHTIRLLNDLIPIDYRKHNVKFGGYPLDLLDALGDHPYFTYVAATIIRNNPDSTCLNDRDFIANLKNRLYDTLIHKFDLTDIEKDIIYSLTLVQDAFPLKLVDMVAEDSMTTKKLLEKGLLLENSPGRFKPLGILQHPKIGGKKQDESDQADQNWHQVFADAFERLYESESDPSFYRQAYYHATLAGNERELTAYNLPEISTCAESWVGSKMYNDAVWAYRQIQEKRKLHKREQMKMASCLIRTNEVTEGTKLYQDLFKRYKTWRGVKNSYVDSLLYIRGHADRALKVLLKIPERERDDYYWHQQAARCYRQLSKRSEAYGEYETAIINAPAIRKEWQLILDLITYAREVGDNEKEGEWLVDYAWTERKLRFDDVKIRIGDFCERMGELERAEKLLLEAHQSNPSNAYCILPLVKTLCRRGKIEEAEYILEKNQNAIPYEILVSTKVVYLKSIGRFSDCEKLLLTLPIRRGDRAAIHRWGQWADLFLSWCQTLQGMNKINKAKAGLKFVRETIEERNVPAMMSCLELSKITGNTKLQETIEKTIREVNDSLLQSS